jgi:hypothetical protein
MVDIETLSLQPNAVVLSIGAVRFDPHSDIVASHFNANVNAQPQIAAKRDVDASTVGWWLSQSEQARNAVSSSLLGLAPDPETVLRLLNDFVCEEPDTRLWGYGATFDNAALRSLYNDFNVKPAWSYKHDRCARTIANLEAATTVPKLEFAGVKHNAYHDALNQARYVQHILKHTCVRVS